MQDWKKIYSSISLANVSMVEGMLNEQGIPAKMLNRQDSNYVFLGEMEIYVPAEFEVIAQELVNSINLDALDA
jgi:hypothetical protein